MSGKTIVISICIFVLAAHIWLLVYLGVIKLNATAYYDGVSELSGTVTDQTGAVITGAWVVLDNGRGNKYVTKTNPQGRYSFVAVVLSPYTLTITAKGFAKFSKQVDIMAQRAVSLDVTLKVFISEKLEVKSAAPAISAEPDKNLSSIVLSGKDLQVLPDDPGKLLERLRLLACPSCRPGDVTLYIDGFRYDGSGKTRRLPPKEVIQMIRIDANPFAAEFSEPGRGRIEITTKPGSDDFHSDVKFDFNDASLNARNALAPSRRPPSQTKDYSGYLMGPVIRNRMDFLVYAGRWEQDANEVVNATTINPATHLAQPFSETVVTPSRTSNFTLHTHYLVNEKHNVGIEYGYTSDNASNQGLQSGLDLPERAFKRSSRENVLRLSLTSIASEKTINECRLELGRHSFGSQAVNASPAVFVLDALNAGGNQASLFSKNSTDSLQFADNLTHTHKQHTFKAGLRADAIYLKNIDRANFGGTFTFGSDFERDASGDPILAPSGQPTVITPLENYRRTLLGLRGYGPSQFSIVQGNPVVSLSQWNIGWFFQDDWRVSPRFTLSYGLRHDFQTHLKDKLNFAPRVGIAWVPDRQQKSTIRAGAGVFYSTVFSDITFTTTKLDGQHQQELTIQRPAFFPDVPQTLAGAATVLQSIHKKSPDLSAPYSIISTVSYERQLPWKLFGTMSYTWQRGVNQLRTRNINAPLLGSSGIRPFPDKGPILQFESTGETTRHEFLLALRGDIGRRISVFSNYTLSSTRSNTDGPNTAPANSYNLSGEFGYADLDQRHSFYMGGSVLLPWGISASPFILLTSAQPFNITTGRDNNGDTLFTDRPAFAGPENRNAIATPFGLFSPTPGLGDSIIPRNFGRATGQAIVSLNITRTFRLALPARNYSGQPPIGQRASKSEGSRRYNLTISANIDNLFNHTNLAGFNGVLTSPLFGKANRALGARRVEFALRFGF